MTIALFLLIACSQPPPADTTGGGPAAAQSSQTLPAGHPPLDQTANQSVIEPPPPGSGTGAAALSWTVPDGWVEETPSSAMRRAQYRVPGPAGDGECVIFYFGPGQGGDAMANAVRWANQFSQPDGRASEEAMKTEKIEVGGIPVLLTEVTGTYGGGMTMMTGTSQQLADHMLLGAIAEGGDANWFFKFTGPAGSLEHQRHNFRSMIESLSRGD